VTAYTLYRAGRAPNAFMAGFLSFLVPGTGQLYAGRLRRGITMLAVTLVVAAAVLAVWLQGSIFVLRLVVQPDVLLALLVANALFFVFHVHCVVDAYRGARRPSFPPRATRSGLIGHAALVAALLALTVISSRRTTTTEATTSSRASSRTRSPRARSSLRRYSRSPRRLRR
jgi:hypothetical protein